MTASIVKYLRGSIMGYLLLYSVICSHFLIQLGRDETFFQFLTSGWYYVDMAYTVSISFLFWTYIYLIFKDTEAKYSMHTALIPGLVRQFCLSLVLPAVLVILTSWAYKRWVWGEDIQQSSFFLYEFYFIVILILLFNVGLYVISLWQKSYGSVDPATHAPAAIGAAEEAQAKPQTLLVESADKVIVLQLSEIALCLLDQNLVFIHTPEGRQYRYAGTLDKLEKLLPPPQFFRANRQAIVNRDNCAHYVVQRSGKIELAVKSEPAETLTISQKKAVDFKSWIQKP